MTGGGFTQKVLKHIGIEHHGHGHGPLHGQGILAPSSPDADPSRHWTVHPEEVSIHPSGGTYPRLTRLSDGGLLAVTTRHDGPTRILQVSRSDDNGRHFAPVGEIARGVGKDVDNGFLLAIPPSSYHPSHSSSSSGGSGGREVVLAAFRNHDLEAGTNRPTHFRITVCRSFDGGRTWEFAGQAVEQSAAAAGGMGLWEPFMRLERGRYDNSNGSTGAGAGSMGTGFGAPAEVHLTYSREHAHDDQETYCVVSRDAGATWSRPPRCLRCHGEAERLRDGMQGVVRVRDVGAHGRGRDALVMVFETTRHGPHFSIEYVVSYDGGGTWGYRGVAYCPGRPGRSAGSPQIATCGRGDQQRMAVVFMTDEDSEETQWPGRAAVKVVFADALRDGVIKWSQPVLVHQAPSFWPGVFCTGDGEILVAFEHGGTPKGKFLRLG
ncbi:hypothetical protein SLS62_003661 [Diatrype stigma]|uniref:Exo-alpha-sialidase n=1 Tax=Diatrype stigma TaxID=117547 RepID=A0AAN9YPS2_9PEZI